MDLKVLTVVVLAILAVLGGSSVVACFLLAIWSPSGDAQVRWYLTGVLAAIVTFALSFAVDCAVERRKSPRPKR